MYDLDNLSLGENANSIAARSRTGSLRIALPPHVARANEESWNRRHSQPIHQIPNDSRLKKIQEYSTAEPTIQQHYSKSSNGITEPRNDLLPNRSVQDTSLQAKDSPEDSIDEKHTGYYESNAGDGTTAVEHHLHGSRLFVTLAAAFLALFISALDQTIVTTIFTVVGNKFNGFDKISWLTSAFLIPIAVLCPSWGRIGLTFGRKSTLLCGIVVFEIGSLVAALSNSMDMLIGGRVIQGVGAGNIQTMVSLVATESVPINHRSLSLSLMAISYAIASVIGPFLGGAFTTKVSWRWCFYINLPLGFVAFLLLVAFYKPPKPHGLLKERLKKIDYIGSILLIIGLVLLLTGLSLGGVEYSWDSPAVVLMVVVGFMFFVIFFMYTVVLAKYPMFLVDFFITPQILLPAFNAFFTFGFFLGDITYLTVYFQVIFKHSALQSGIDLLPLIISVTLSAVINGVILKYVRFIKPVYIFSGICGVVGNGLLLLLDRHSSSSKRIGFLIVMGVSIGFQVQCTLLSCQLKAPRDKAGSLVMVTVFANFNRFVGGCFGVTLASAIFNAKGSADIKRIITALPNSVKKHYAGISASEFLSSPKTIGSLPKDAQEQVLDAFMISIRSAFYLGLAFSCMALICCLFATNKSLPKDKDIMDDAQVE